MSTQAVNNLEQRAAEQRRQIHESADELRGKIAEAKEKLDVRKNLRGHLFAVCIAVGAAALLISTIIARKFRQ